MSLKNHLQPAHGQKWPFRFFDFSEERQAIIAATPEIDATDASNKARDVGFPRAVRQMGWTLLQAGDAFDPAAYPYAIVVGVFIWDNGALRELEYLHEKIAGKNIPVFAVDMDASANWDDITKQMPQLKLGFVNSPILMEYRNGVATQWNRPATYRRISEM